MKRSSAFAFLFAVFVSASAAVADPPASQSAQSDPMATTYGNTVTASIQSVGYESRRYIDPDHTWRETSSEGPSSGTWEITREQVCFTYLKPEAGRRFCNPATPHKIGDVWLNKDPLTGNEVSISLVAGRP